MYNSIYNVFLQFTTSLFVPNADGSGGRYCKIEGTDESQITGRLSGHTLDEFIMCGGGNREEESIFGYLGNQCVKFNPDTGLWGEYSNINNWV